MTTPANPYQALATKHSLTPGQLARIMFCSKSNVSRILSGESKGSPGRLALLEYWSTQQGSLEAVLSRLPVGVVVSVTVKGSEWEAIVYKGSDQARIITSNSPRLLAEELEAILCAA